MREIDAQELEHFAFKALTTWGELSDYKYFLPRIIELSDNRQLLCDMEVTLGKFAYGGFRDWPADEQNAVRDYIMSAWQDAVKRADTECADSLLCGAGRLFDDISPLLAYADSAAPDFRSEYRTLHSNQTKRRLLNSYWEKTTSAYRQVLSWLYPEEE